MEEKVNCRLSAPLELSKRKNDEPYKAAPYRNEFQRDRDRILYSKEFRRLSGKTQVFLPASHDHVRTRLTHTLEVSQISRVTARCLDLEPSLAESIALGHDVGHTPFGHVGEKTLSLIMNNCDQLASFQNSMQNIDMGFKHNLQSLRVICELEQLYGFPGLNISNFTLWGIVNHTSKEWSECPYFANTEKISKSINKECLLNINPKKCINNDQTRLNFYNKYFDYLTLNNGNSEAWSFEGQVVKQSDEIAQRHHDIEDAIFMGIISNEELIEIIEEKFLSYFDDEDKNLFVRMGEAKKENRVFLPLISKFIIGLLNKKLIQNSVLNLNEFIKTYQIKSNEDFQEKFPSIQVNEVKNLISYEKSFRVQEKSFQDFLKNRILNSFEAQRMDGKGKFIIRRLFKAYLSNPRQLHDSTIFFVFRLFDHDNKNWANITKADIGEMRNSIDSTTLKSDPRFRISLLRAVCDHIAGMTDNFAMKEYKKLYG